jgi:hypothetical protein
MAAERVKRLLANESRLSGQETARYTKDLLAGLEEIAVRQRQHRLVELLQAAALEADRLAHMPEKIRTSGQ